MSLMDQLVPLVYSELHRMAHRHMKKERPGLVELKFFGGLSIEETAEVLGVSPGTVMRD